jgi:hypothetical protein
MYRTKSPLFHASGIHILIFNNLYNNRVHILIEPYVRPSVTSESINLITEWDERYEDVGSRRKSSNFYF